MTIEERLERLEKQLRRTKRILRLLSGMITCFGIVAIAWTVGQAKAADQKFASTPNEVHASKFILKDGKGYERAVLAVNEMGAALEILDENDTPRAHLMVIREGPVLSLRDERGRPRVQLAVSSKSFPAGVSLYNEKGISLAQLFLTRSGKPALTLFDENAKPRIMVGMEAVGPLMAVLDAKGGVTWSATK